MATANLTKRTIDASSFTPNCDYFVWDSKLKELWRPRHGAHRRLKGEFIGGRCSCWAIGHKAPGSFAG